MSLLVVCTPYNQNNKSTCALILEIRFQLCPGQQMLNCYDGALLM
jgi:hypothetical protein